MSVQACRTWLVALGLLAVGCEQKKLEVTPQSGNPAYGHDELDAAVARYSRSERSPARYRELAEAIAALAPRFNQAVAMEAERHLVFLALGPLQAVADKPLAAQMPALATTLWPTVLGVEPLPGEAPLAYTERICRDKHAALCQHVLPEYRPFVLGELVWKELKGRARNALAECSACTGDDGYIKAIAAFDRRHQEIAAELAKVEGLMQPSDWPAAGEHAASWSGAPVVTVDRKGAAWFGDQKLKAGAWREPLAAGRGTATVLGLSLPSSVRVGELRAILRDAAAAGFPEVALQVRDSHYPYPLKEYRLSTRPATPPKPGHKQLPSPVRDADSIQLLIEALDAQAAAGGPPPSLHD